MVKSAHGAQSSIRDSQFYNDLQFTNLDGDNRANHEFMKILSDLLLAAIFLQYFWVKTNTFFLSLFFRAVGAPVSSQGVMTVGGKSGLCERQRPQRILYMPAFITACISFTLSLPHMLPVYACPALFISAKYRVQPVRHHSLFLRSLHSFPTSSL